MYDLDSLVRLQEKRRENVALFEQAIKNERAANQQDEVIVATLSRKLRHEITETEREAILSDLPKLESTRINREKTIALLQKAISSEYDSMNAEDRMIRDARKV